MDYFSNHSKETQFLHSRNSWLISILGECEKQFDRFIHLLLLADTTKWLEGNEPKKVIVVPGRIVNSWV